MKFSIRDLLLVTVIVALALGWWLDHRAWVEAYSTKTHDNEIWEARAEELQVRVDVLAEQWRAVAVPSASASAPNPSAP